jgi:outer membrane biosynthesis protein TonB
VKGGRREVRFSKAVRGFVALFLVAVSLVSACGAATPESTAPAQEVEPTSDPVEPTDEPAEPPTEPPTEAPTEAPTEVPTEAPTEVPTQAPTEEPTEETMAIDAEALLQERCTECHALNRTTNARKSSEQWDQTVSRMVDYGVELSDEEQAALVDYLAETYGP